MKIRINGKIYSPQALPGGETAAELRLFLQEWFSPETYVVGHTSGSTGKPKEIRLSKADMRASARLTNDFLGIGPQSVLLLCLSVSYIAGKMMVVRALEAGAELWVTEVCSHPLRREGLPERIDLAAMVPLQVEQTLSVREEAEQLQKVCRLLIGGAPVSSLLEGQLQEIPTDCYVTYGMTETVSHVALRKTGQEEYEALGEVRFSSDERGCLVIYAPHLQEKVFVTNDLVCLKDATHFKWLGRWDNVINSGGIKYFPEVLEKKISSCIRGRFFITSQPDPLLGQQIVLVVEGKEPGKSELEDLYAQLRIRLEPFEMPRAVYCCAQFRETSSGKVIRRLPDGKEEQGCFIPVSSCDGGKK